MTNAMLVKIHANIVQVNHKRDRRRKESHKVKGRGYGTSLSQRHLKRCPWVCSSFRREITTTDIQLKDETVRGIITGLGNSDTWSLLSFQ